MPTSSTTKDSRDGAIAIPAVAAASLYARASGAPRAKAEAPQAAAPIKTSVKAATPADGRKG